MPRYFGTDGIRGPVATSPLLSSTFLHRFGTALVTWAQQQGLKPSVVIATDTRSSCERITYALANSITDPRNPGLCTFAGVLPTPGLQHLIRAHRSDYTFGIMVSASHNTASDNGIKLMTANGKLTPEQIEELEAIIEATPEIPACLLPLHLPPLPTYHASSYISRLSAFFPAHMLRGVTVALDCAHGATAHLAPAVFQACGATVHVTGATPSGTNINQNCGSVHPEHIQAFVKEVNADIGFAFDGDGDRVIAVNKDGEVKGGDHLLALLMTHPRFAGQETLIGTVMTNFGLEQWLHERGKRLLRTPVGDSHVLHAMHHHNSLVGGEPSGHIILLPYLPSADGILVALFAAHTAQLTSNMELATFTACPQVSINVPAAHKHDLTGEPYASIIQAHRAALIDGRSIVRYSGTEHVLRIMTEHHNQSDAQEAAQTLATALEPLLRHSGETQ